LILRFYNVFLIVTLYKIQGDFKRIMKLLETNVKGNMNLVDSINNISHRTRVKREISFYVLHILTLKAGALIKHGLIEKA
jgi:hypothetical protein